MRRASSIAGPATDRHLARRTAPIAPSRSGVPAPVPGRPGEQSKAKRSARKVRGTFSLTSELFDELRNAAFHLSGPPLRLTMASLAEMALRRELDRLKLLHNCGRDFPARTANLTAGRPLGS